MIVELYLMFVVSVPDDRFISKTSFIQEQTMEQCNHRFQTLKATFKGSTTEIFGECIKWEGDNKDEGGRG